MQPVPFGPFRLDEVNECLWQGGRSIALRPKVFAVLKYLIEHRGQLVTKERLLEAIWPGTYVGDAVLKDTVSQLREALGRARRGRRAGAARGIRAAGLHW